jgi:GrpB-like predicted nucleotidyltransferase (UPF0157 family)
VSAPEPEETKHVSVVPYDADWPARYGREARALAAALGETAVGIEHIGSTSIPGLAAKPTIDILVGTGDTELSEAALRAMHSLGYEYRVEMGAPGRRYFRKGPRYPRDFNVHIVLWRGSLWHNYLAFRDYLRDHPQRAMEYAEVKQQALASHEGSLMANYATAKEPFIAETLRRHGPALGSREGA